MTFPLMPAQSVMCCRSHDSMDSRTTRRTSSMSVELSFMYTKPREMISGSETMLPSSSSTVRITTSMPSVARCWRSRSTTLPTPSVSVPSTRTRPAVTFPFFFTLFSVSSITSPHCATTQFFASMPISLASSAWRQSIRCSPWTGMKNLGFVSAIMVFCSCWQAWPETWISAERS